MAIVRRNTPSRGDWPMGTPMAMSASRPRAQITDRGKQKLAAQASLSGFGTGLTRCGAPGIMAA
jgi:hypothetical protein